MPIPSSSLLIYSHFQHIIVVDLLPRRRVIFYFIFRVVGGWLCVVVHANFFEGVFVKSQCISNCEFVCVCMFHRRQIWWNFNLTHNIYVMIMCSSAQRYENIHFWGFESRMCTLFSRRVHFVRRLPTYKNKEQKQQKLGTKRNII